MNWEDTRLYKDVKWPLPLDEVQFSQEEMDKQAEASYRVGYEEGQKGCAAPAVQGQIYLEGYDVGIREVVEWVEANIFTGEKVLCLEDYNEWKAFLKEKVQEEDKVSFTDQESRIATQEDLDIPWESHRHRYFRCKLCGYTFKVGDYWRWVYMSPLPNILVCEICDQGDLEAKWKRAHDWWEELKGESSVWWFIAKLEDERDQDRY